MLRDDSFAWRPILVGLATLSMLGSVVLMLQHDWTDAVLAGSAALAGWTVIRSMPRGGRAVSTPGGRILALLGAAAGIALALLWQPTPDRVPELVIVATGQKNPAARSAEIWVAGVGSLPDRFDASRFEAPDWELRDQVIVSYRQQPSQARWSGSWTANAVLRINRHPHSGIALVRIGASEQRLDLYSEAAAHVDVPLPAPHVSAGKRVLELIVVATMGLVGGLFAARGDAASIFTRGVIALAVLIGASVVLALSGVPVAGPIELVVVHGDGGREDAAVSLDAGQGFLPQSRLPIRVLGTAVAQVPVSEAPIPIAPSQVASKVYRRADAAAVSASLPLALDERTESFMAEYPASAAPSVRITLPERTVVLTAPPAREAAPSEPGRLFLVGLRDAAGIRIGWTRTTFQLAAWEAPTYAVRRVRLEGVPDAPSVAVMRAAFDAGLFLPLQPAADPGVFALAGFDWPDDTLARARKAAAGLTAAAFTLMLLLVRAVVVSMRRLWNGSRRLPMVVCAAAALAWLGAALHAGWPGMVGWDGFSPYIQHGAGNLMLWYGIGYPLLVSGLLYLGGPQSVVLFQMTTCLLLVCWAANRALERGVPAALPVSLVVAGLPLTTVPLIALTHLRDALNGLLLSGLAVLFYAAFAPCVGRAARPVLLVSGTALGVALVLMRSDNLVFLAVLLAAAVLLADAPRRRSALAGVLVLGTWLVANPILERVLLPDREAVAAEKRLYRVTGVINPIMGQLVVGHLPRETVERASEIVDKVMDARHASAKWTPFNIIYWHETYNRLPSEPVVRSLWKLYVELALQDPATFVRVRSSTFLHTLGLSAAAKSLVSEVETGKVPVSFHDHLLGNDPYWRRLAALVGFPDPPHPNEAQARALLEYQVRIATHVPQLIVLLACAALVRRMPVSGAIALAGLARAAVFWALEPASVFLYLSELQLLGLLLPMLAWAEWRVRRPL